MIRPFKKIAPEKLMERVKNHPDDYLREIAVVFNCSDTATRKVLKKLKITRKNTKKYYEQNPEQVKEYLKQIQCIDKNKFVYVDESR